LDNYKRTEVRGTYGFQSLDEEPFLSGNISLEGGLKIANVSFPSPSQLSCGSNLENINALSCNVTKNLILFLEMSAEHFCRLINSVLDFHSNTTTSLRFLDNLQQVQKQCQYQDSRLTSNDLWLISKEVLDTML